MKHILSLSIILLSFSLSAQVTNYEMFRKAGLVNMEKFQYERAVFNFEVAKASDDSPEKADIDDLVYKATECLKYENEGNKLYKQGNKCAAKVFYLKLIEINSGDNRYHERIAECDKEESKENPTNEISETKIESSTPSQTVVPEGMVMVEGGKFAMGWDGGDYDEKPEHKIEISSFLMDATEVTNKDFCAFLNEKGNQTEENTYWIDIDDEDCHITIRNEKFRPKRGYTNHPVIAVSWYGAKAYAKWQGKRLPTEAEWEYAAKGGNKSKGYKFSGSNNATEVAWFDDNSESDTKPVGKKQPNEIGIYDMSGNVWEWCNDWYEMNYYSKSKNKDPQGPPKGQFKIVRGGSWVVVDIELRMTLRNYNPQKTFNYAVGFRCVKDIK